MWIQILSFRPSRNRWQRVRGRQKCIPGVITGFHILWLDWVFLLLSACVCTSVSERWDGTNTCRCNDDGCCVFRAEATGMPREVWTYEWQEQNKIAVLKKKNTNENEQKQSHNIYLIYTRTNIIHFFKIQIAFIVFMLVLIACRCCAINGSMTKYSSMLAKNFPPKFKCTHWLNLGGAVPTGAARRCFHGCKASWIFAHPSLQIWRCSSGFISVEISPR